MHPIVVLHGANGSSAEVSVLAEALQALGPVWCPDLLGHGGRPIHKNLDLRAMALDIVAQLDGWGLERAVLVGYSLGGTLALYMARHHPDRVIGVCTLAAKVLFDAGTIRKWVYLVDPERLGRPDNPRGKQLEKTHAPQDWSEVARMNRAMFLRMAQQPPLSEADLRAMRVRALVLSGDQDQIVPLDETRGLATTLGAPGGAWRGFGHPLAQVPLELVIPKIAEWASTLPATPPSEAS